VGLAIWYGPLLFIALGALAAVLAAITVLGRDGDASNGKPGDRLARGRCADHPKRNPSSAQQPVVTVAGPDQERPRARERVRR